MINNFITFFFIASLLKRRAIWTPNIGKETLVTSAYSVCVCGVLIYFPMTYVLTFSTHCWRRVRKKRFLMKLTCTVAWRGELFTESTSFSWQPEIMEWLQLLQEININLIKLLFSWYFSLALGLPQNRWETTTLCYMQHLVQCAQSLISYVTIASLTFGLPKHYYMLISYRWMIHYFTPTNNHVAVRCHLFD